MAPSLLKGEENRKKLKPEKKKSKQSTEDIESETTSKEKSENLDKISSDQLSKKTSEEQSNEEIKLEKLVLKYSGKKLKKNARSKKQKLVEIKKIALDMDREMYDTTPPEEPSTSKNYKYECKKYAEIKNFMLQKLKRGKSKVKITNNSIPNCDCENCKNFVLIICHECYVKKCDAIKYRLINEDNDQNIQYFCTGCIAYVHYVDKKYIRITSVATEEKEEILSENIDSEKINQDVKNIKQTGTKQKKKKSKHQCDSQIYLCELCYKTKTIAALNKKDFFPANLSLKDTTKSCMICRKKVNADMCFYVCKEKVDSTIQNSSIQTLINTSENTDTRSKSISNSFDSSISEPSSSVEIIKSDPTTKFIYVKNISDIPCKKMTIEFCLHCHGFCYTENNMKDQECHSKLFRQIKKKELSLSDTEIQLKKELKILLSNKTVLQAIKNTSNKMKNNEYEIHTPSQDSSEYLWTLMIFLLIIKYNHLSPGDFIEINFNFSETSLQILNSEILKNTVKIPTNTIIIPENSIQIPRCQSVIIKFTLTTCTPKLESHKNIDISTVKNSNEDIRKFNMDTKNLLVKLRQDKEANKTDVIYYTIENSNYVLTKKLNTSVAITIHAIENLKDQSDFGTLMNTMTENSKEETEKTQHQDIDVAMSSTSCSVETPVMSNSTLENSETVCTPKKTILYYEDSSDSSIEDENLQDNTSSSDFSLENYNSQNSIINTAVDKISQSSVDVKDEIQKMRNLIRGKKRIKYKNRKEIKKPQRKEKPRTPSLELYSENINGYIGNENLDTVLDYIEGKIKILPSKSNTKEAENSEEFTVADDETILVENLKPEEVETNDKNMKTSLETKSTKNKKVKGKISKEEKTRIKKAQSIPDNNIETCNCSVSSLPTNSNTVCIDEKYPGNKEDLAQHITKSSQSTKTVSKQKKKVPENTTSLLLKTENKNIITNVLIQSKIVEDSSQNIPEISASMSKSKEKISTKQDQYIETSSKETTKKTQQNASVNKNSVTHVGDKTIETDLKTTDKDKDSVPDCWYYSSDDEKKEEKKEQTDSVEPQKVEKSSEKNEISEVEIEKGKGVIKKTKKQRGKRKNQAVSVSQSDNVQENETSLSPDIKTCSLEKKKKKIESKEAESNLTLKTEASKVTEKIILGGKKTIVNAKKSGNSKSHKEKSCKNQENIIQKSSKDTTIDLHDKIFLSRVCSFIEYYSFITENPLARIFKTLNHCKLLSEKFVNDQEFVDFVNEHKKSCSECKNNPHYNQPNSYNGYIKDLLSKIIVMEDLSSKLLKESIKSIVQQHVIYNLPKIESSRSNFEDFYFLNNENGFHYSTHIDIEEYLSTIHETSHETEDTSNTVTQLDKISAKNRIDNMSKILNTNNIGISDELCINIIIREGIKVDFIINKVRDKLQLKLLCIEYLVFMLDYMSRNTILLIVDAIFDRYDSYLVQNTPLCITLYQCNNLNINKVKSYVPYEVTMKLLNLNKGITIKFIPKELHNTMKTNNLDHTYQDISLYDRNVKFESTNKLHPFDLKTSSYPSYKHTPFIADHVCDAGCIDKVYVCISGTKKYEDLVNHLSRYYDGCKIRKRFLGIIRGQSVKVMKKAIEKLKQFRQEYMPQVLLYLHFEVLNHKCQKINNDTEKLILREKSHISNYNGKFVIIADKDINCSLQNEMCSDVEEETTDIMKTANLCAQEVATAAREEKIVLHQSVENKKKKKKCKGERKRENKAVDSNTSSNEPQIITNITSKLDTENDHNICRIHSNEGQNLVFEPILTPGECLLTKKQVQDTSENVMKNISKLPENGENVIPTDLNPNQEHGAGITIEEITCPKISKLAIKVVEESKKHKNKKYKNVAQKDVEEVKKKKGKNKSSKVEVLDTKRKCKKECKPSWQTEKKDNMKEMNNMKSILGYSIGKNVVFKKVPPPTPIISIPKSTNAKKKEKIIPGIIKSPKIEVKESIVDPSKDIKKIKKEEPQTAPLFNGIDSKDQNNGVSNTIMKHDVPVLKISTCNTKSKDTVKNPISNKKAKFEKFKAWVNSLPPTTDPVENWSLNVPLNEFPKLLPPKPPSKLPKISPPIKSTLNIDAAEFTIKNQISPVKSENLKKVVEIPILKENHTVNKIAESLEDKKVKENIMKVTSDTKLRYQEELNQIWNNDWFATNNSNKLDETENASCINYNMHGIMSDINNYELEEESLLDVINNIEDLILLPPSQFEDESESSEEYFSAKGDTSIENSSPSKLNYFDSIDTEANKSQNSEIKQMYVEDKNYTSYQKRYNPDFLHVEEISSFDEKDYFKINSKISNEMATLEETKSLIRSLLVSTQKTLNINQLNKDFKEMEGRYIPYHLFGFRTLEEMLKSMPDTVKLHYVTDRFGNSLINIQLVLSENIAHLDELVMSQRKNQRMRGPVRKTALKPQPIRSVSTPPYQSHMEAGTRGSERSYSQSNRYDRNISPERNYRDTYKKEPLQHFRDVETEYDSTMHKENRPMRDEGNSYTPSSSYKSSYEEKSSTEMRSAFQSVADIPFSGTSKFPTRESIPPMRDDGNSYTPSSSYKSSYEEKSSTQMRSAFQSVADIPFYGTSKFPTRESIPWCTLKNRQLFQDSNKSHDIGQEDSNTKSQQFDGLQQNIVDKITSTITRGRGTALQHTTDAKPGETSKQNIVHNDLENEAAATINTPSSLNLHHGDTDTYQKDYPSLEDTIKNRSMLHTASYKAMEFIPLKSNSYKNSMIQSTDDYKKAEETDNNSSNNKISPLSFAVHHDTDTYQKDYPKLGDAYKKNSMLRDNTSQHRAMEFIPINSSNKTSMNREIQQEEAASYMSHPNNNMPRETEYLPPPTEEDTLFDRTSMSSFSQRSNYMDPHYSPRDFLPQIGHQSQSSAVGAGMVHDAAFRPTQHAQTSSYAAATPSSAVYPQKSSPLKGRQMPLQMPGPHYAQTSPQAAKNISSTSNSTAINQENKKMETNLNPNSPPFIQKRGANLIKFPPPFIPCTGTNIYPFTPPLPPFMQNVNRNFNPQSPSFYPIPRNFNPNAFIPRPTMQREVLFHPPSPPRLPWNEPSIISSQNYFVTCTNVTPLNPNSSPRNFCSAIPIPIPSPLPSQYKNNIPALTLNTPQLNQDLSKKSTVKVTTVLEPEKDISQINTKKVKIEEPKPEKDISQINTEKVKIEEPKPEKDISQINDEKVKIEEPKPEKDISQINTEKVKIEEPKPEKDISQSNNEKVKIEEPKPEKDISQSNNEKVKIEKPKPVNDISQNERNIEKVTIEELLSNCEIPKTSNTTNKIKKVIEKVPMKKSTSKDVFSISNHWTKEFLKKYIDSQVSIDIHNQELNNSKANENVLIEKSLTPEQETVKTSQLHEGEFSGTHTTKKLVHNEMIFVTPKQYEPVSSKENEMMSHVPLKQESSKSHENNNNNETEKKRIDSENNKMLKIIKNTDISKKSTSEKGPDLTDTGKISLVSSNRHDTPYKVRRNLKILLNENEDGIWAAQFEDVFKARFQTDLNPTSKGYKNTIDMVKSLPAIFNSYRPHIHSDLVLTTAETSIKSTAKKQSIPTVIVDRIKNLLKIYPEGILTHRLGAYYQGEYGDYLDTHALDYDNFHELLFSLGCFNFTFKGGDVIVSLKTLPPIVEPDDDEFHDKVPSNVMNVGDELPPQEFPCDVTVGSCTEVLCAEIHNPSKFYLHFYSKGYFDALQILMVHLQQLYTKQIPHLKLKHPHVGMYVACCYNGDWHRARIMEIKDDACKVLYVDYGTEASKPLGDIYYLLKSLTYLPPQAFQACLYNLKPKGNSQNWSREASQQFYDLLEDADNLFATFTNIDKQKKSLVVFMTGLKNKGNDEVHINSTLVDLGCAENVPTPQHIASMPINQEMLKEDLMQRRISQAVPTGFTPNVTQIRSDHPTQSDHVEFSEMESVVESMYDRYGPSVLQVLSSVAAKKQGSRSASSLSERLTDSEPESPRRDLPFNETMMDRLAREMQSRSYSRNVSESSTIKKEYTFGTYKS